MCVEVLGEAEEESLLLEIVQSEEAKNKLHGKEGGGRRGRQTDGGREGGRIERVREGRREDRESEGGKEGGDTCKSPGFSQFYKNIPKPFLLYMCIT